MNEKRDVDHVLSWKELPDGSCLTGAKYDEFIQGSGNRAVKLEDQVAGIKGQLSARLASKTGTVRRFNFGVFVLALTALTWLVSMPRLICEIMAVASKWVLADAW
eukprot:g2480.t1